MADLASYDTEIENLEKMSKNHLLERVRLAMDVGGDVKAKDLPCEVGKMREQLFEAEQRVEQLSTMLEGEPLQRPDGGEVLKIPDEYISLFRVFQRAGEQASAGKGKERHAKAGEPFEKQKICEITRRSGLGFPIGQAAKKSYESLRLGDRGPAELLGAINYLAAAYLVMSEELACQET